MAIVLQYRSFAYFRFSPDRYAADKNEKKIYKYFRNRKLIFEEKVADGSDNEILSLGMTYRLGDGKCL